MTLIFSDFHWGLKLNSELHLEIAKNNIKWLIDVIKTNNIKRVIFCGDWFHQRSSVSVNTMHIAYENLKLLAATVKEVHIIVGNHDCFYKNTTLVHSLKAYEQFENVKVYDKPTNIKLGNYNCLLVPWLHNLEDIKNEKADIMFGHFEPNGCLLNGELTAFSSYSINDITNIAPLVFSGHFHAMNEYKTENHGRLIFIGSPSQQNWGDVENKRGCFILNEKTLEYKFIENTEAPCHKKFYYSTITKTKKLPPKNELRNNFIKLIVDTPYKFSNIQTLLTLFNKANPQTVEAEYFYSDQINTSLTNSKNADTTQLKTHIDYIREFIMNENIQFPEAIDRNKLLEMSLSVYKLAQEGEV